MDTDTILRAISNLPAPTRDQLLQRMAQMVVEALAGGASGAAGRGFRGRGRGANGSRSKIQSGSASEEQVLAHIKSNPDQRTEQIAAALGTNVKPALKKLRESKLIRTKGQKRAMTYSVAAKS
jgi:hypothetical protein